MEVSGALYTTLARDDVNALSKARESGISL